MSVRWTMRSSGVVSAGGIEEPGAVGMLAGIIGSPSGPVIPPLPLPLALALHPPLPPPLVRRLGICGADIIIIVTSTGNGLLLMMENGR